MASLKDTKKRIGSVKNTQKITRAMKLVSSAKYARAYSALGRSKEYSDRLDLTIAKLGFLVAKHKEELELFASRSEKKILLVVCASDRGLCGALNSNIIKNSLAFVETCRDRGVEVEFVLWGRKALALERKYASKLASKQQRVLDRPSFDFAHQQMESMVQGFESKRWDAVYVAYSQFNNVISQSSELVRLLPLEQPLEAEQSLASDTVIVEPATGGFVKELLVAKLSNRLFRMMLDGAVSEHAARMTAMDNATNNAEKVIKELTLEYNRARQAAITTELIEITSGAEAL